MEIEDTMDTYESEEDMKEEFGKNKEGLFEKAKGAVTEKAEEIQTGIGERVKEEQEYRAYRKEQAKKAKLDFPTRYAKEQERKAAAKVKRAERRVAIKKKTFKALKGVARKLQETEIGGESSMGFDPISPQKGRVTRQQTPQKQPTFDLGLGKGAGFSLGFGGESKGTTKPARDFKIFGNQRPQKGGTFDQFEFNQKKKGKRKEFSIW